MNSSLFFALCVAVSASLYQVFQRQAAGVNAYLVAMAVSATALVLGFIFVLLGGKVTSSDLLQTKSTWFFLVLIGLCAFGIDFFTSRAYAAGGAVSMIGPVITITIVVFSGIFGALFFKEPLTLFQVLGLILMVGGVVLTAWKK